MPMYRVNFSLEGHVDIDAADPLEASYKVAKGLGPDGPGDCFGPALRYTEAIIQGNPEVTE